MNARLRPQHHASAPSSAERTDTLVISNDDNFLVELGPLIGDRYRVHAVDTPASIGDQVSTARWIGIVDVDSQAGARGAVSRLELQHPGCPLILITARPEEWVRSVMRGQVLAAIDRAQVASAQLSQTLRTAEDQLRLVGVAEREPIGPSAPPGRFDVSPPRRASAWAGAALLLGVLAVSGVWLHHRFAPSHATAGVTRLPSVAASRVSGGALGNPAASAASATRQQSVLELLSAARVAFHEQRLLPPRPEAPLSGDSALELYAQVLRQDPNDEEALAGVRRLLIIGRDRIMGDIASGKLEDASRLLEVLTSAGANASELQSLASLIKAARPNLLAQRAQSNIAAGDFSTADELLAEAVANGADAATVRTVRFQESAKKLELQLASMATQVKAAIQGGALLPPAVNNARTLLSTMRTLGPHHPLTLQAEQQLQTALVQAGEQATRAALFELAQRDLNAVAELGSFAPLSEARRQLQQAEDAARGSSTLAATTVAPTRKSPPPEASGPGAAPSTSGVWLPPPFLIARPTNVLYVKYPPAARGDGTVVVEFTLSAKGAASDITIVRADPPGMFDTAAVTAVKRGRYSTADLVNHQPERARIKLRFNMPTE